MRMTSMGMLGYVMMNSSSMLKAIEKLSTHQRLVASVAYIEVQKQAELTCLMLKMEVDWEPRLRYTLDFMVAALCAITKNNLASAPDPVEVGFTYKEPDEIKEYHEVFSAEKIQVQ